MTLTHWQDTISSYNPMLTAGNTWVRVRESDDLAQPDGQCYDIYNSRIRDDPCAATARFPLCTIYSTLVLLKITIRFFEPMFLDQIQKLHPYSQHMHERNGYYNNQWTSNSNDCSQHCTEYI